jgi:hypothetical protein
LWLTWRKRGQALPNFRSKRPCLCAPGERSTLSGDIGERVLNADVTAGPSGNRQRGAGSRPKRCGDLR